MSVLSGVRLLVFVLAVTAGHALAAEQVDVCRAPDDAAGAVAPLPHVAVILKPGSVLEVLAVGSATMFGSNASLGPGTITSRSLGNATQLLSQAKLFSQPPSERAFPLQMVKAIRSAVPGLQVNITVRGGRSLLATDMLSLLRTELAAKHFDLVLWQTGTVEAVRNVPPGEFAQTLSDGADAVLAANANLVLIDPQYSRFLQTNSNMEPYELGFQQVAAMPGVVLFRRYDLMRGWANDSQIDLERTPQADRQRVIEVLHACLGKHLARLIIDSARS